MKTSLSSSVVEGLLKVFSTEDKLAIVMDFNDLEGKPFYMEYPGIPVLTLINKSIEIELVYWRCSRFGTVEFDFF